METRVNIAVGAKAMSLATGYPVIQRLIASTAVAHRGTELGATLHVRAAGAPALDSKVGYHEAWTAWARLRQLNTEIEDAWVALEPMMSEDGPAAEHFTEQFRAISTLAEEWEVLVGAEHPAMRLLRLTDA